MTKGLTVLSLFDGLSGGQIALERAGIKVDKYFASEIEKEAIDIAKYNYPNTIEIGDVTKVKYENGILYTEKGSYDVGNIDLVIGGSPCFVAETPVLTEDGYKNIESLVVGEKVLTHKNKFEKIIETGGSFKEIYSIEAQGVFETETTENHPYYIRKKSTNADESKNKVNVISDPYWEKVKNIEKGDYLGIPIPNGTENKYNLTKEECWILGRYLADGHYRSDKRKNRENSYHYQVILSIGDKKVSGFKEKIKENNYSLYKHSQSVHRAVFSSMRLVSIIEKSGIGKGAKSKQIPPSLLCLPVDMLKELLEGYFSGDGCQKENKITFNSVSKNLIISLQLAILKVYRLPITTYISEPSPTKVIEGRTVNQSTLYCGQLLYSFEEKRKKWFIEDEIVWLPVKKCEKTSYHKAVFNIEVENDNSYTANNAIVHNCQGFSFAGKQLNFDDPRSKLFFEFDRIVKEIKPNYFFLENVKMKKESEDVITEYMGVKPDKINSSHFSAQSRERLYWTNIDFDRNLPECSLTIEDILEKEYDKFNFIEKHKLNNQVMKKNYMQYDMNNLGNMSQSQRAYYLNKKSCTLDTTCGSNVKFYFGSETVRRATILELERLQTLPEGYTSIVKSNAAAKAIGNGWTINVIAHIFKGLNK